MIEILKVFMHAFMITGFVFVMMLAIEYFNVQTQGLWQSDFSESKWKQYLLAAILGAIPGCLGAYTAVALFSHRLLSFGAIVTAMIATSGDEAFVMFAMFPEKATILTIIIFIVGIIAGFIVDKFNFFQNIYKKLPDNAFSLHEKDRCNCFNKEQFIQNLLKPSRQRIILFLIIGLLLTAVLSGILAGDAESWIRGTIILVVSFSLFVVISVPEHFIKKHIWEHIVKVHTLRIFLWTFGTLLAIHFLMNYIDVNSLIASNMLIVLLVAVLVGIIPESGPHLVFVTLFAQGSIPFSILLASSISQDGHGMLPLLAESKKGFIVVKVINVVFALIVGLIGYVTNF
jgi:hypothetical protein